MKKILEKKSNLGLLILRVAIGGMMLLHGIHKLFHGLGFIEQVVVTAHLPTFIAWGVYIGEIIAPVFIILGFRTRLFAAIMAFNCLLATILVHNNNIFTLNEQGGWVMELLGLYFFSALTLTFSGGGKIAMSYKNLFD